MLNEKITAKKDIDGRLKQNKKHKKQRRIKKNVAHDSIFC